MDKQQPCWRVQSQFADRHKHNVLLVDDDSSVRASMARVLESADYTVIQAANGVEALDQVSRQHVDLVLLDLNMPGKNGWDTLERLAAHDPCLPVIVMTAYPGQLARATTVGVGALMEKPLDFPKLLQTVRDLLKESSTPRKKDSK